MLKFAFRFADGWKTGKGAGDTKCSGEVI